MLKGKRGLDSRFRGNDVGCTKPLWFDRLTMSGLGGKGENELPPHLSPLPRWGEETEKGELISSILPFFSHNIAEGGGIGGEGTGVIEDEDNLFDRGGLGEERDNLPEGDNGG